MTPITPAQKLMAKQFGRYDPEKLHPTPEQKLIVIDYASKLPQYKSKIAYFNELFYEYFVWSLREFFIPYDSRKIQETNNLIFNVGAYKKYTENNENKITMYVQNIHHFKIFRENYPENYPMYIYYPNISPTKYAVGYIEGYRLFVSAYGERFLLDLQGVNYPGGHFHSDIISKIKKYKGYQQDSPNIYHNIETRGLYLKSYSTFIPSPLGKYYFELEDNKNTFIEFYLRIYPKLDNPPKGWDMEMMKKLERGVE